MYSLAVLMKYFLKNCQNYGWLSNEIYMNSKKLCPITLY